MSGPVTVPDILGVVSTAYDVPVLEILGDRHYRDVVQARQMAMYLSRQLTDLSYPRIGQRFGRDHTTVLHACRKVERQIAALPDVAVTVESLRRRLVPPPPVSYRDFVVGRAS